MATTPLTLAVALALNAIHSSVGAQIPSKFENLRVLPKDISRDSLLAVMNGFANGLGVQCGYCHSGGDPRTLIGVEFKADDKPTKVRARAMYTITSQVNDALRTNGAGRQLDVAVNCYTCHRGMTNPQPLWDVLAATITRAGVDSAITQYRELRVQLLDRGRYDFGEASLNVLARMLALKSRRDDAIRILELNKEFHPDLPTLNFNLAELYLARGDSARALDLYLLVLAKQPLNARAKARVDSLRAVRRP